MPGTLGQPIDATLNYQPGGNPLAGMQGGLPGLALSYGQDYNAYLAANQKNYNNIVGGYNTVRQNIANTLGQGGSDWGIAQPAANQIVMAGRRAAGGAIQNSINSGVGKSTAAVAAQRGVLADTNQGLGQLGAQLADKYAGYESQLGQSQLGFMNSVQAPPPNAAAYGAMAQQYGIQQQGLANMAMQQQALDAQTRAAGFAASRSQSAGGGARGVSIGQAPRGGNYGSGGGGFPSGGGVSLSDYGIVDSYGKSSFGGGGGSGTVYPSGGSDVGGYNPWTGGAGAATGGGMSVGGGGSQQTPQAGAFGWTGLDPFSQFD